jgi:hypothetical protein
MKLYRTTGYTPLLTYFVAEDDVDALNKAAVALWEDMDAIPDEAVVVRTIRRARSLEELDDDKWLTRIPLFIPDTEPERTCAQILLERERQKEAEAAARQTRFFFVDWDGSP